MKKSSKSVLYTIGHSTHPIEEFIEMLEINGIERLVDVRTVPKSRHNPQFGSEALAKSLKEANIEYAHTSALGGLRRTKKDSINTGWRNASFRGYADYMQSQEFKDALEKLEKEALNRTTVIMCAEAVPWRCHRSLIADALIVDDWEVRDIMSKTATNEHKLTSFAKVKSGELTYPPEEGSE